MSEQHQKLLEGVALLDLEAVLENLLDSLLLLVSAALGHEVAQNEPDVASVHVVGCVDVEAGDVAGRRVCVGSRLEHGQSGQFEAEVGLAGGGGAADFDHFVGAQAFLAKVAVELVIARLEVDDVLHLADKQLEGVLRPDADAGGGLGVELVDREVGDVLDL